MRKHFTSIKEHLKEFSTFNYAERRGIAILVGLIVIVEAVNAFLPVNNELSEGDLQAFQQEFEDFQAALNRPDTIPEKKPYWNKKTNKANPNHSYQPATAAVKPPMVIEINTADSAALVRLRGIGPVFANRILKYRGLLGGYVKAEQLLEVYGMDTIRYKLIENHIQADTGEIIKIAVNEADFKTILRHPYLDYETVKDILNYRKSVGPILNPDSLRKIIAYDPIFEKVRHYIAY
jgi:DNA uptake protein ComE-like DNA-binding protein